MAKETIERIREAESRADALEKSALKEAEEGLKRAEEEAEHEAGARIAEAKALAEQERTEAHQKAEIFRQGKQLSAEKEILYLREMAAAWEEEAIRAMIRFLGG